MAAKLETIPGADYSFTQPVAMRLDELVLGRQS
jgi:Cu/Ag efflux pump CusA